MLQRLSRAIVSLTQKPEIQNSSNSTEIAYVMFLISTASATCTAAMNT